MESSRKEIASAKELMSMADSSKTPALANDTNDDWLYEDDPEEEIEEIPEDELDDFDDEPVAKKKTSKKEEVIEEEDEDFEDDDLEEEEKPKDKKKPEDPELVEIPGWAKKIKELYPDQEFKSFEEYDKVVETHLNGLESKVQNLEMLTNKWGELAVAYPGLDKFIASLEMGQSPVIAAMEMGISPEDFEVYDESELDAEAKILKKHELKKQKEARIKAQKEVEANITNSTKLVDEFTTKKKLEESEKDVLVGKINEFVETVNKGIITESFLEFLTKGVRYEKDTKKEAEHAYIKGRNERFQIEKKKKMGDGLPGLQGGRIPKNNQVDGDDFVDMLDKTLKRFG